ncbi:MAG: SOS response-associated peptidase [Paludibacter sp.]|nr:SOS response-associated peptidase [Paludibacter sp.]
MCFSVAIVRNNTLLTLEKYYDSLPNNWERKNDLPEFPDYFFLSGFSLPLLPIIKDDGIFLHQWGLIPSWIKTEKDAHEIRSKTLNAKGETIFEKPSFKKCIQNQRCILPVAGFFEYREMNGLKYPYFIHSVDHDDFFLGSVYDRWINEESGEVLNTFSIVTTPANTLMEKIRNLKKRMPLIIRTKDSYQWIDRNTDLHLVEKLICPYDELKMNAYTISRIANNARMNRNLPEIMNEVVFTELDAHIQTSLF